MSPPSWRGQMRPAQFRGVPFFVDSAERSGGRRTVQHEYPFKNEPFVEDMGRKARSFPVEGFVVGDDYIDQRIALSYALEQPGPGELIHPYHGSRRVMVAEYRIRESASRGGVAQFSIDFIETPAQPAQPSSVPDGTGKVRLSAAAAVVSVGTEFTLTFSPGALLDGLEDLVADALDAMDVLVSPVLEAEQEIAAFKFRVQRLASQVSTLIRTPATLLSSLVDLVATMPAVACGALLRVYAFSPGARPPATTSNRRREQENFDAIWRLFQRLLVIQAALLAPGLTYDSFNAAVTQREAITDLLDEQIDAAADDTYPALLQLRADLVKAVPGEASDLPRLVSHIPPATLPSLVLAHRLYGDVSREADLVARNRVQDPGFVTGGEELEVLSRGD